MPKGITVEQFKQVVPLHSRKAVTPEVVEKINQIIEDPKMCAEFRDNLLSYTSVMKEGRFRLPQYINAVKYMSYKLLGNSNIAAWIKTFPDSYNRLKNEGATDKDMAAYVAAYNKTKLVNLIREQSFIPTYILNADLFQKALNTQADLMINARSEKVRSDAANSILTHLKRPEIQKMEIDMGVKEDKSIQSLRESTMALVRQQREMIAKGQMSALEAAHSELVVVEAEDASD